MSESVERSAGGRRLMLLLLVVAAVFVVLGFVHLRADFPNRSPWSDWSKMTDEGWYGSGAVQHFVWGGWYLPKSFNPAVAMPVWPVMLGGWFAVTGVGMLSARALTMVVYAASLALLYGVVRRSAGGTVAALAVLMTAANPLCWSFDRLAVLEPVTVFWMMLGMWIAAGRAEERFPQRSQGFREGREGIRLGPELVRGMAVGAVLCLLVMTKATGVAVAPAVLYLLWANGRAGQGVVARVWPAVVAAGVAAVLWAAYFVLLVKPHYLADYRLLFSINAYRVHLSIVPQMAWVTLRDGLWLQPVLFPAAVVLVLASGLWLRGLWRQPLFVAAVVAAVGHLAYVGYHTNFQPRYYLVIAMPMAMVIALGAAEVWRLGSGRVRFGVAAVLTGTVVWMAVVTLSYALHPEYSFLTASQSIASILRADGGGHPVLLADSGADMTLFTGIEAVDEGYTTEGLDALLARYHPGWFAAWPGWEDPAIAAVGQRYRMQEVARYRVFDDPTRQVLVLYKLSPRNH